MYWLNDLIELLDTTHTLLKEVTSYPSQPSSPMNDQINKIESRIVDLLQPNIPHQPSPTVMERLNDMENRIMSLLQYSNLNNQPVKEMHSISSYSPPCIDKTWSVSVIHWFRFFPDLFYAGFGSLSNGFGSFGLFSVDKGSHPGRVVATEGSVLSIDINPSRPELISAGLGGGFNGVVLYRLRGEQHTVDLSSVEGRRSFRQRFISSSSDFGFENIWKIGLSDWCCSVLWNTVSELFVLAGKQLMRLKMQEPTSQPTEEVMFKPNDNASLTCMALQGNPRLSTSRPERQHSSVERELTDPHHKLVVGSNRGNLDVFMVLPVFRSVESITNAHCSEIRAIEWNAVFPEILASGSGDRRIKLWNTGSSEPILTINLDDGVMANCLRWAPFSSTLLSVMFSDQSIGLFDFSIDREKPIVFSKKVDQRKRKALAFNTFKRLLLVGFEEGKGFESFELRPSQMTPYKNESCSVSSVDVNFDMEIHKLKQIFGI